MHPFPTPALLRTITVAILSGLATVAVAQTPSSLEAVAPRETILAVGLTPEPRPQGDLDEALDELDWERAGEAWSALVATLEELAGELPGGAMALDATDDLPSLDPLRSELEAACPDLDADLDALAEEGWAEEALLTVSADAFSPFPAGLLAIRTAPGASDAVEAVHERLVGCFGGEAAGEQDGTRLHVLGDGSDLPLVLARRDDLTLVGTRPDVVRGALRRFGGAGEPSFADAPIGAATAGMEEGGLRVALHAAALADVAETRLPTPGDEAGALVRDRIVAALRTLGGVAWRLDATEAGLVAESALAFDPEGGDAALAELLACDGCRASAPDLVPADAFAASGRVLRAEAWFDYLDGLVRDLSGATGTPTDLRTLLREEAGVDVDAALFDWIGDELQTVRLEPFSPELRDLVLQPPGGLVMPVASAAAAEDGLGALADLVRTVYDQAAASNPDLPDDLDALVSVREADADGVPYRRVRIGPGSEYGVGLVGDRLVIASPASAFDAFVAVERGEVPSAANAEGWARVQEAADGRELTAWSYGAGGGDLNGLADLVATVAQPLAFLAATGLDLALEEASDGGASVAPPADDPFADPFADPFGGSGGTTVDVATASPSTTLDLSGIGATALDVPVDVGGELSDASPRVDGDRMDLVRLGGLEAGTRYRVEMTSDAFDTYLYLIRASDGGVLASNDDAPSTNRSAITFTADGETALLVGASSWSDYGGGAYQLRVSEEGTAGGGDAPADVGELQGRGSADLGGAEPRSLPVPTTVSGELAGDDATVLGKRADLYRLEGLAAGDVVTIEMTSDPIDTYLYLIDGASDALLAENDDAPFVDRSELRFTADGERDLVVAATSFSGRDEGPYELAVEVEPSADDAATPADSSDPAATPAEPDAPTTTPEAGTPEAPGADGADAPDETTDGSAEEEPVAAPTFDELLALFDVAEGTIRTIGERFGPSTSIGFVEDDVARTIARQAIDW